MSIADLSRPGIWTKLFPHALALMDHLAAQSESFTWTFGGGTVLMLRLNHRHSKDIDPRFTRAWPRQDCDASIRHVRARVTLPAFSITCERSACRKAWR